MAGSVVFAVSLLFTLAAAASVPSVAEYGFPALPRNVIAPRASGVDQFKLKAVESDWFNLTVLSENYVSGIAVTFEWSEWEPEVMESCPTTPPPAGIAYAAYDGRCYIVPTGVEQYIVQATNLGLTVHANVYGLPDWASANNQNCQPPNGEPYYCTPDDPTDYVRFVSFLVSRYNGTNATTGLINSVSILHNANINAYYNIGCGSGSGAAPACDVNSWVNAYATIFAATYDAVQSIGSNCLVLACFDHSFEDSFDAPTAVLPTLSVKTFLRTFIPLIDDRVVRLAYHPYGNANSSSFSPDDFPVVGYGNLGALSGWLIQEFPDRTELWNEIAFTESGITSSAPGSTPSAQANAVCQCMWNVLGTPGIINYVWHRMIDSPADDSGQNYGLVDASGAFKPSWAPFSHANGARFSCGFGNNPNTKLQRSKSTTRNHWVSSRLPPTNSGYLGDKAWFLWLAPVYNATTGALQTIPLFECLLKPGGGNIITPDPMCEADTNPSAVPLGSVGYIFTPANQNAVRFLVPLYRCFVSATNDYYVSGDANCDGSGPAQFELGYALPAGF